MNDPINEKIAAEARELQLQMQRLRRQRYRESEFGLDGRSHVGDECRNRNRDPLLEALGKYHAPPEK